MKYQHLILPSLGIAVLVYSLLPAHDSRAQPQATGLPGARPAIEAIGFPTLQAAIDALPAEGGIVRIPAGTFEIDRPLVLTREDVALEGAGTATHIKNVNKTGRPALLIQPVKLAANPKAMQWRVRLANFRITGNPQSGHGIQATNVNELFVDGVTVSYHGGDGIHMENCYEDPRICDNADHLQQEGGPQPPRLSRYRGLGQPVRGEPGRAPLRRQLQPLHDGQQRRRPPERRRRDREYLWLGGLGEHDRGVRGDGHRAQPRLLRRSRSAPT